MPGRICSDTCLRILNSSLLAVLCSGSLCETLAQVSGRGGLPIASTELAGAVQSGDRNEEEYFEKRIRPVLAENCFGCHGPQLQTSGLRLDRLEGILQGGSRGPAII